MSAARTARRIAARHASTTSRPRSMVARGRTLEERASHAVAEMSERGCCLLCGERPAPFVGLFVPTPEFSARLMAPAGKHRTVLFCLCPGCKGLPDAGERADAEMMRLADEARQDPSRN